MQFSKLWKKATCKPDKNDSCNKPASCRCGIHIKTKIGICLEKTEAVRVAEREMDGDKDDEFACIFWHLWRGFFKATFLTKMQKEDFLTSFCNKSEIAKSLNFNFNSKFNTSLT